MRLVSWNVNGIRAVMKKDFIASLAGMETDVLCLQETKAQDEQVTEALKDIENNEAIKANNVDEEAKKNFLKGADIAYEQIITSFAKGDKKSLKNLLGKELFTDFSEVIDERRKKQLKNETTFIGVKSSKVLEFKKIENITLL